jgi:hypothetical protein
MEARKGRNNIFLFSKRKEDINAQNQKKMRGVS